MKLLQQIAIAKTKSSLYHYKLINRINKFPNSVPIITYNKLHNYIKSSKIKIFFNDRSLEGIIKTKTYINMFENRDATNKDFINERKETEHQLFGQNKWIYKEINTVGTFQHFDHILDNLDDYHLELLIELANGNLPKYNFDRHSIEQYNNFIEVQIHTNKLFVKTIIKILFNITLDIV